MELKVTEYVIADGIATIRLNRPGRGNSWTNRMNAEYRWIMATLDADSDVRVVVVTGAGKQFCVGADTGALNYYKDANEDYSKTVENRDFAKPGYGVNPQYDHDQVWQWGLRMPVIAAINGACAGIAVALAGFCDLRYAAEGAIFTTAAPRLGLPAEYGLAWLLPRMVGITNAADILMTGRKIPAEEMLRIGFLNGVFPAGDDFIDHVYKVAKYIASQVSPTAVTVAKRQLYSELLHLNIGEAIDNSKELIGLLMHVPDFNEGVSALVEKRDPNFGPRKDLEEIRRIAKVEK